MGTRQPNAAPKSVAVEAGRLFKAKGTVPFGFINGVGPVKLLGQ